MKYIIFFIALLSILIKDVSMLSAVVAQISSLGFPDNDNQFQKCSTNMTQCTFDKKSVCLYARLSKAHNTFPPIVKLATMPDGTSTIAKFNPPTFNKITYMVNQAEYLQIYVNKCEFGPDPINLDVFFNTWIDTTFFINCKNCIGTYRGYKMTGTISISDMKLTPFKGIRADISEIQFLSQKYNNNLCCYGLLSNNFDGCNFCDFNIRMIVNLKTVDNQNFDYLNSWVIDRNYNYPITINMNGIQTVPLNLGYIIYQSNDSEIIDQFQNLQINELPYTKTEFTLTGDNKRVKMIFNMSSYSIHYNGGNSQYEQPNLLEGTNLDLIGNIKCADRTLDGKMCDKKINRCTINSFNPCINGGKCWGTKKAYNCDCPDGYKGKNCQLYYCSNRCVNSKCVGPQKCGACNPGWTGKDCQDPTCDNYEDCKSGTCILNGDKRICKCIGNATGNYCQFDCRNSCNNGVCGFSNGVNLCICNDGWYGSECNKQTIKKAETFYTSKNFFIAIGLIIGIGIIIIIVTYILMTKYLKTHVKSNIHLGDITQFRQTLQEANLGSTSPNFQNKNTIISGGDPKIYKPRKENQVLNLNINKEINKSNPVQKSEEKTQIHNFHKEACQNPYDKWI